METIIMKSSSTSIFLIFLNLIHQLWECYFWHCSRILISQNLLVYFSNYIKIMLKHFALLSHTFCQFSGQICLNFGDIFEFNFNQFQILFCWLLLFKKSLIYLFFFVSTYWFWFLILIIYHNSSHESTIISFMGSFSIIFFCFFRMIKKINDLFRSILNHWNQTMSFVFSIYYHFRYFAFQLSIFLTRLRKILNMRPQFFSILKVDEKLCKIWHFACAGITKNLSCSILLKFNENRCITAFRKGQGFTIREKHIITIIVHILATHHVENEKFNFIE